jgi:hypothetical protein
VVALASEVADARAALDAAMVREDALVGRLTAAEAHDVDMCAELAAAEAHAASLVADVEVLTLNPKSQILNHKP